MRMRVIPEQAGRMVSWNLDDVMERVARHGHHVDYIVLWGLRRNLQAMEMEIRHVSTRRDRATLRGVRGQVVHIRDLERVSGIGANGWRDAPAIIGEGIPALGIESRVQCERNDATL